MIRVSPDLKLDPGCIFVETQSTFDPNSDIKVIEKDGETTPCVEIEAFTSCEINIIVSTKGVFVISSLATAIALFDIKKLAIAMLSATIIKPLYFFIS
jgi:hypothetical protein